MPGKGEEGKSRFIFVFSSDRKRGKRERLPVSPLSLSESLFDASCEGISVYMTVREMERTQQHKDFMTFRQYKTYKLGD